MHFVTICPQAQGSREAKVSQMDLAYPRGQDQLGKTPPREGKEAQRCVYQATQAGINSNKCRPRHPT